MPSYHYSYLVGVLIFCSRAGPLLILMYSSVPALSGSTAALWYGVIDSLYVAPIRLLYGVSAGDSARSRQKYRNCFT